MDSQSAIYDDRTLNGSRLSKIGMPCLEMLGFVMGDREQDDSHYYIQPKK